MKPHNLHNRRLISWLLLLTLLCTALPAGASWQCLNGTPCPLDCPLLMAGGLGTPACESLHAAHCSKCVAASASACAGKASRLCPLSQCTLKVQAKPDAALTDKHTFALPLLALPPPAQKFVVCAAETVTLSYPLPRVFTPQRFLRPCLGRAPPVFL